MRYINIGGEVIPKHCKFGPRPAEGVVFNKYEWWSITDHLVKEQREKEIAAVLKAKDEAKKEISFNMTRNWNNTLASVKTQGNQKRQEKLEKIKQDKIEKYNEIIKNREEERKKIMEDVKKLFFYEKDPVLTINSGVLYSEVLDERRQQIELKNKIQKEAEKKEAEWVTKMKNEVEEERKEKLEEQQKEREKKKMQKQFLDEQVEDKRRRQKKFAAEQAAEKQDLINMRIESENIHKCNMVERNYRKNFTAKNIKKTQYQLDHERNLVLEEKEEDEINKIYQEFEIKYKKERKEREDKIKNEEIEKRVKRAELLAQEMRKSQSQEEERVLSAIFEKERKEKKLEEEKEALRRQGIADILEGKRKAEERRMMECYERNEEKKWEMMQQYRRSEINRQWIEDRKKRKEESQANYVKELDLQCKELQERREEEKREIDMILGNEAKEREELRQYCDEVLEFAREQNLPEYPILLAISKVKKNNKLFTKKELEEMQKEKEQANCQKRSSRVMEAGCYCLK